MDCLKIVIVKFIYTDIPIYLGGYQLFIYAQPALEKLDALGILKSDVENAVKKGSKWKEDKCEKWHAQMAGIEIVFIKEDQNFIIITSYLAGRKK